MCDSKKEEMIGRIQKGLKCSREEAEQVYESDCAIDRGEKQDFDLTLAQQNIARKFAHTGTRKQPTTYKLTKRERKPDETKGEVIEALFQFLAGNANLPLEDVQILEKERKIGWNIGKETFELTLARKRKKN